MKRLLCTVLSVMLLSSYSAVTFAAAVNPNMPSIPKPNLQAAPNARTIEFAFVFDGPSDKNAEVIKTFQKTITLSLLPDYKAAFPKELIFSGDWTKQGAINASNKALASRATMVISLGYLSSDYYSSKKNKNKYVVTIDQYGLRDFGNNFFNPLQQSVNDFITFKNLVPNIKKVAILMNENFYKTQSSWNTIISKKLKEKNCNINYVVIPISSNVKASLAKIPSDVDSVFITPLFNLTSSQRKEVFNYINSKKLPSFSSVGQDDVDLGVMLGTSAFDVDRKLAEATSFNIHGVLHGSAVKNEKIPFYDDKVLFFNSDTAELLGYTAPLRLLNNSTIISHKELPSYDLDMLLTALEGSNLDMARKRFLVSAARRSVASAYLRYLPTLRLDLGYQTYNSSYAESYSDIPTRAGAFTVAMDQVLYSPDLVTNIIVKHKKLKFDKAEAALIKANTEYQTANLYIDTLMLENALKVQEEYVEQVRETLAMARVREKTGKCGKEETLRWAGEVSEAEKKLLAMKAEHKNIKIHINKLLNKDQKSDFRLKPLTASDKAFFSSDVHIIDHVRNPKKLEKFTEMLVDEVIYLSPETTKLKAAIAMKKAELSNYAQKFVMPNAKMSLEYTTQFDRNIPYEDAGHNQIKAVQSGVMGGLGTAAGRMAWANSHYLGLDKNSFRFFIGAQWKPIEGGHKFAEIARCKSELNELNAYLEEVDTEIEMKVRSVVNRAISKYFMIEKSYKAMFAQAENYQMVKQRYLVGKVPVDQVADAQELYFKAKLDALNSQYEFFKELIWVQRGLLAVNWAKANDKAKEWMNKIPSILPYEEDFSLQNL